MNTDPNRRFVIEELNNGWLLKITEAGSDKFIGRYAFVYLGEMFEFLEKALTKEEK